jgi:molybdate transport system substrate-binding protein
MKKALMALAVVATAFGATNTQAAEIHVLIDGRLKSPMTEIMPLFEQATGHKLVVADEAPQQIVGRLSDAEQTDVVISSSGNVDDLIKRDKVHPDSKVIIARSGLGVAVRKGAPRPDISSAEAFKRALLEAKSIAYAVSANGGDNGAYFTKLAAQLGIANEIGEKAKLGDIEAVAAMVGRGEAEIGILPIDESRGYADRIDVAGPLPEALQSYNYFAAAIAASSKEPEAARDFLTFLAGSTAQEIMRTRGFESD